MRNWTTLLSTLAQRDDGATMIEYALMVSLIALAVIVSVTALGLEVFDLFEPAAAPLT